MLWKILIGVAAVLILFLVVAATRPAAYRVERKLAVGAPPDRVFAVLNDLQKFVGVFVLFGKPLEKADPKLQKTFEGPSAGKGQSFAWSGKEAGKGKLTIEESVPGQKVVLNLEFVEPMESKARLELTLAPSQGGTDVSWSMAGDHNFLGKAMGVLMNMDNMMGADLEKGLAELKTAAEAGATAQATP